MTSQHPERAAASSEGRAPGATRVGSPFADDPLTGSPEPQPRQVPATQLSPYDLGPLRYTAMGAVAAAAMVLVFGVAAAWTFPVGGALIAGLGCTLSLFGMISTYRWSSMLLLVAHLGMLVLSFSRTFS